MQTHTTESFLTSQPGQEADAIVRSCVHCGFCNATCPTYQLLGDELDGPRGRIYLMKQMLEGQAVTQKTQMHLDRCLSCLACETTCPSGVKYGRLVDIGRELVSKQVKRTWLDQVKRIALRNILPFPKRFSLLLTVAQAFKFLLPVSIKQTVPSKQILIPRLNKQLSRKMIVLEGCAQFVITPNTNSATSNVLHELGIETFAAEGAGCCGAVSYHLSESEQALDFMRRNIDAWWPYIEQGAEAIVITASGCGAVVKDYAKMLKHDARYAEKAKIISKYAKDISEILLAEKLDANKLISTHKKIAFQSPCSLQHGQQLNGVVESLLTEYGFNLVQVDDAHICCGSAGTYSILQKPISQQLLEKKLSSLEKNKPDLIVTANVGCQLHLLTQANIPVKHWIELVEENLID